MNPYAPPSAPLADREEGQPGRPLLVWVITVLAAFGLLFDMVGTILLLAGHPIGGDEAAQAAQFLGSFDHLATLAIDALSAIAVIALFRLKRSALPLFLAAFAATAAFVLLESLFHAEYRALFQGAAVLANAAGWLINVAIVAYVWRLHARSILRA